MNNDIRPPRPQQVSQPQPQQVRTPQAEPTQRPTAPDPVPPFTPPTLPPQAEAPKRRRKWPYVIGGLVLLMSIAVVSAVAWYTLALRPVSGDTNATLVPVTIESGMTPTQIAQRLHSEQVIRSPLAFDVHTRLQGVRNQLQAGEYRLSPADTTREIVEQLLSATRDEISITFYPGAMLVDNSDVEDERRVDVTTMLLRAGYSQAEITAALERDYDHPLLASKPTEASLEGYIYGETYSFFASATVESVLERTFDEMYRVVTDNNLEAAFAEMDMTLHEGIILASIIQREVGNPDDQRVVSQIFHSRLAIDMQLGADATFVYAANQRGITPAVTLDSLYNTRIHSGLPPGPIAVPGATALVATANPADTEYLYFVSGDDGRNYFSRTLDEHERNTRQYCIENCSLF